MVTLRIITGDEPVSPQHITKEYLEKYGAGQIFVETGTYMGDTVKMALEFGYEMIHSVELNDELYNRAVEMFADNPKVKIWHGDSAEKLQEIVNEIGDKPATFWLDAHASGPLVGGKSGGSPVVDELKIIKSSPCKEHSIFIDDKRLFGSAEWSFVREEDAMNVIRSINEDYKIVYLDGHVKNDVICATLKA
jgi:hypothetical protein